MASLEAVAGEINWLQGVRIWNSFPFEKDIFRGPRENFEGMERGKRLVMKKWLEE